MKKFTIALLLLMMLSASVFGVDNLANYKGKSAAQLSAMTDYVTIPNTSYWNNYAYAQIKALVDGMYGIANDTLSTRYSTVYGNTISAVYHNSADPIGGVIQGSPNTTEVLVDTTIWLNSFTNINIPESHKFVSLNKNKRRWTFPGVFSAARDSFIVLNGGRYYGCSDTLSYSCTLSAVSNTDSSATITSADVSVTADSLIGWYLVSKVSGTYKGMKIKSNDATSGTSTRVQFYRTWSALPTVGGDTFITPMDEYQPALAFNACKNVWINNVHVQNFPGDGLNFTGDGLYVNNSIFDVSYGWFYGDGSGNSLDHNLVGRVAMIFGGGNVGNWPAGENPDGEYISTIVGVMDTTRNLYFNNTTFKSGGFDGIDIEPGGDNSFFENVIFENCRIIATQGRTAFEILIGDSTKFRNLIFKNCYIEGGLAGFWITAGAVSAPKTGYIDNVLIEGCTIQGRGSAGYGFYWAGSNIRNITIRNNEITGFSHAWESNADMSNVVFEGNYVHDNGALGGIPFITYTGRCDSFIVRGNRFVNNGTLDSTSTQVFLVGMYNSVIENNLFLSDPGLTNRPLQVEYGDSIIIRNNIVVGHVDNSIHTWDVPNLVEEYNVAGFLGGGSASDSLRADLTYTYGNNSPGDTTAALYNEAKRVTLLFNGYRDTYGAIAAAKIVGQSTANPGYGSDPWKVQSGNLLFYTLSSFSLTTDDSRLRAIITGNGLGLADSSYINFFPKNSASNTDPDTLWRYVGESGYGLRDSSGYIQYKNSGGDWANIGSVTSVDTGSGTGDMTGPASSTNEAIAIFDGTDGKKVKNSLATVSSSGELSAPVVYAHPSSTLGFLVSREAILAGTDSCANLGITDGAGALTLYAGNGHNSQITVNNSDVMLFKNAAYYAFQGAAANAIYVSGEKVFAASDSFAALQVSGGCGQLYLVSGDGLPEYATITLKNTDHMEFAGAIKYDFDAEINTLAGTNPGTDTAGDVAIDTDDSRIEFHDGTASRVIPALQCRTFTILEPDIARGKTDDIILFHVMADAFPHGITIKDIALSASAAMSDTHVIEEWSDRAGSSQSTIESITMSSATYQEDDGTLSDAAIAADAFININLDDSTDDIASLEITITFYVNEGD